MLNNHNKAKKIAVSIRVCFVSVNSRYGRQPPKAGKFAVFY